MLSEERSAAYAPPLIRLENGRLHIGGETLSNVKLETTPQANGDVEIMFTAKQGEKPWRIEATMAADWTITVHTLKISLNAQALALALLDIWPGYHEIEEHLKQLPTAMQLSADTLTMLPTGEITAQLSLQPETSWRSLNEIHLDIGLPKADTNNEFGAAQATLSLKHSAGTSTITLSEGESAQQLSIAGDPLAIAELVGNYWPNSTIPAPTLVDMQGSALRRMGDGSIEGALRLAFPETWAGLQQVTIDQLQVDNVLAGPSNSSPLRAAMRISVDSGHPQPLRLLLEATEHTG